MFAHIFFKWESTLHWKCEKTAGRNGHCEFCFLILKFHCWATISAPHDTEERSDIKMNAVNKNSKNQSAPFSVLLLLLFFANELKFFRRKNIVFTKYCFFVRKCPFSLISLHKRIYTFMIKEAIKIFHQRTTATPDITKSLGLLVLFYSLPHFSVPSTFLRNYCCEARHCQASYQCSSINQIKRKSRWVLLCAMKLFEWSGIMTTLVSVSINLLPFHSNQPHRRKVKRNEPN